MYPLPAKIFETQLLAGIVLRPSLLAFFTGISVGQSLDLVLVVQFISLSGDRLGLFDCGDADFFRNGHSFTHLRILSFSYLLDSSVGCLRPLLP